MNKYSYGEEQVMFIDYYKAIRPSLDNSQRGVLLDLLVDYLESKQQPAIDDPLIKMSFGFLRNGLDRVTERYEKRRKTNQKNVNKRWGNE